MPLRLGRGYNRDRQSRNFKGWALKPIPNKSNKSNKANTLRFFLTTLLSALLHSPEEVAGAAVAVVQVHAATGEVQVIPEATVRRTRPIVADRTGTADTATGTTGVVTRGRQVEVIAAFAYLCSESGSVDGATSVNLVNVAVYAAREILYALTVLITNATIIFAFQQVRSFDITVLGQPYTNTFAAAVG